MFSTVGKRNCSSTDYGVWSKLRLTNFIVTFFCKSQYTANDSDIKNLLCWTKVQVDKYLIVVLPMLL